ncbi:hypothetical protein DKX38_015659 [Salix brachista]|uniref:Uncharacterized protein n=1 Tax=Salix brachista TaxID=2182728 RepID=A0A5N5L7U5_9ROSI|nr:hypothetical protein DKX38_015659 [Salix brachista]
MCTVYVSLEKFQCLRHGELEVVSYEKVLKWVAKVVSHFQHGSCNLDFEVLNNSNERQKRWRSRSPRKTEKSMEESLLLPKKRSELEGRERLALTRDVFTQEAKKLAYIAGPMVVTTTSLYLLLVISNMMVGHLGELALSSAAISVSFCNVTA